MSIQTAQSSRPKNSPNRWLLAGVAFAVLGTTLVVRSMMGESEAVAQSPRPASQVRTASAEAPTKPAPPQHDVMAIVNGRDINRTQLAQACVEQFGEEVLESLVNKQLIEHHCRNRGITITNVDIEAEIDRMAKRFKLAREQWLELLERERGVKIEEYKRDILWPTIALRKLASHQLNVTDSEIKTAYENRYGAAVQVRMIVVPSAERAAQLSRQLTAQPDDFARLAMSESIDVNSASIGGLIQPIRMHSGEPELERQAFALEPGQISQPIAVHEQFVVLKCEGRIPPRNQPIAAVQETLVDQIKEEKLREVANGLFKKLQDAATIQNVYNDPQLRQSNPGVVALVNGEQVTMRELGAECLARHGEEVLEGEISQLLLQMELKQANLSVSQDDLTIEITHAAKLAGVVSKDGKVDLERWITTVTKQQGITREQYINHAVWPSAALKKLTRGKVEITNEDLQKGYEANYGARVRCRAVVLAQMRRAQEVWAKARENESMEFFCDLAEEYSIEPTSKQLRGEVPPIRKHGGQPQLEKVAFELQPNQLSGIVQVGDKFIILKCEGRTEPVAVGLDEVRDILRQDIFEKKMRLAMAETYERLHKLARIDNYLAGTSQAPAAKKQDRKVRQTGATR